MARRLGVYSLGKYFGLETAFKKTLYNPLLEGDEVWELSELQSGHPQSETYLESTLEGMQLSFTQIQKGFFPPTERRAYIERFRAEFTKCFDNLVQVLEMEVAKPYQLAKAECDRALKTTDATLALFETDLTLKAPASEKTQSESVPSAHGIALAVTPFNFPINLVLHKILPAIAAGCPVIWRPSPKSQLVSLALLDVLHAARLPAGMLAFCPMNNDFFWKLLKDSRVACVSFTGSSPVGWKIHSEYRGPLTLELGGTAPVWIDPSVAETKFERTVDDVLASAFSFGGQSCISAQNLFIPKKHSPLFIETLNAAVKKFSTGPAWDQESKTAGVIDADAKARIEGLIAQAKATGSHVVAADKKNDVANFVEPTLIYNPPKNVIENEAFAPILNVIEVENFDEFLARTNTFTHRLQAAVYADDARVLERAARELNFGGVGLNMPSSTRVDALPYGGRALAGLDAEAPILAQRFFAPYKTLYKNT